MDTQIKGKRFSKDEAIRFGWKAMRENLGFFILFLIASWLISSFFSGFAGLFEERIPLFSLLFYAGYIFVAVAINIISIKIALRLCDGRSLVLSEVLQFTAPQFFRFLGGYVLYTLLVTAGLILFVVPGVIWMVKYEYVIYLIIDRDMDIGEAFKKSGEITAGVKWELFAFLIVLGLINIAGALCFLVGLFATIPTSMVAMAYVYRKLSKTRADSVVSPFAAPQTIS